MEYNIIYLKNDLRINNNHALAEAVKTSPSFCLYIYDSTQVSPAQKWWLHYSLTEFKNKLNQLNIPLVIRKGEPVEIIKNIKSQINIKNIFTNKNYINDNIGDKFYPLYLLKEPDNIKTGNGGFYKVYTPFSKTYFNFEPTIIKGTPTKQEYFQLGLESLEIENLDLINHKWQSKFANYWTPGENAALKNLEDFVLNKVVNYAHGRDFPAENSASHLSPYLHFGEISPHQIWHVTKQIIYSDATLAEGGYKFLNEIIWRDFNYNLLYNNPNLATEPFNPKFKNFIWKNNSIFLEKWKKGLTGFPIIDAGMRELWETGFMHNRVRMIVASFLTKHLQISWQEGEKWFWETLVDADFANNICNWQWVAGCGADAAPYFRIFNPCLQSAKFDKDALYIKKWLPELKEVNSRDIHNLNLKGKYREPIIDLNLARQQALDAYKDLK